MGGRLARHSLLDRRKPVPLTALLGLWALIVPGAASAASAEGLPTAVTSRVFGFWDEWQIAYKELVSALDEFAALSEEPISSADRLFEVMEARDRLYRTAGPVEGYIYLRLQMDSGDEAARSRQHLLDETDRRWYSTVLPAFTRALTDLGRQRIAGWMEEDGTLARYDFFFRRFFDSAEHPYPEGQEQLRALFGIFENQTDRVYKALAISEAPIVEVTLESGERVRLTAARTRSLLEELPSAPDRGAVSRAWLESLGRQSQTYAAVLEGIVGRLNLMAEVRSFESALAAHLNADAIPAETVRQVIRSAREGSASVRRYHTLRKKMLGLDEYGLADRLVPLDRTAREIGFEDARSLIVESTSRLGPEVQDLVRKAFTDGWIDAVERPGKRVHGGSTFVGSYPFVLVNYRGSLEDVFRLTHEIGHCVHAVLAQRDQPFVYSHRSSLTSEAAAAVFEGVLVDQLIADRDAREDRIQVLDLSIQNLLRLFYRPMLDADFELSLYETEGPITGPSLGERYLEVVSAFYGDSLRLNEWGAHAWLQTPHFYTSPLYLGRYGLATVAATALVSQLTSPVEAEAEVARQSFVDLMKSGSRAYPVELLKLAGADLDDPRTRAAPILRLDALVDELDRVANVD